MKELRVKVCGMRERENISGVALAGPDYMGFIFYSKSSRYVGENNCLNLDFLKQDAIKKVGVFVNEAPAKVISICQQNHLNIAQLHGNESPEDCCQIKQMGLQVIKAFSLDEMFDFDILETYAESCDFFLFDTKGLLPGGTGQKFNWQLLDNYQLDIPFFLSGGIRPEDLNSIRQFHHPMLYGVDINSGFELSPALKDVAKVQQFITGIRSKK
ncbi:MAG TPA: phosphoribosylanthranilate isomerase [Prolixibacteraceae bacterium]|nr:phosphoribosylanthranilate isomerase [Prolixibacteraceae bacterium]